MTQVPEEKARQEAEEMTAAEAAAGTVEETDVEIVDEDEDNDMDPKDKRIEELESELAAAKNMALRTRADLENFRKRTEREKQENLKFANRKIFQELLDVLDNFDRALIVVPDPADNFVIGVKMIQKQLLDVLGQNGVEEITAMGRQFDPYLDEAIAREASAEHEENTVIEVFQKGFRYKGQLLRPTKVKVAVKPEPADESTEAGEPATEE